MMLPALVKNNEYSRTDHHQLLPFSCGVSSAETDRKAGKTNEKEGYDK